MFLSVVDVIINPQHILDHCPWIAVIRFYKTLNIEHWKYTTIPRKNWTWNCKT